jgi:carboxyl-terminal processing protease
MKTFKKLIVWSEINLMIVFLISANQKCMSQNQDDNSMKIFDIILTTLDSDYFDPTYGGLNWKSITDSFRPKIKTYRSDDTLYYLLDKMLFNLGVSHLAALPKDKLNEIGDPQLTVDGTAGLDVAYIDGKAIITKVMPNSPAFEVNLRPGYEITDINNKSIKEIADKRNKFPTPPFNERNASMMITSDILKELYGTPGKIIRMQYMDSENRSQETEFPLMKREQNKTLILNNLPMMYTTLDSRIINKNIGYIRFDIFHPVLLDTVLECIKEYQNLPYMILDIRGNAGGEFITRKTIAEQFVDKRTLFWRYKSRKGIDDVFLEPADKPFTGKLIILIDERSCSSSEEFSGSMKAIGRATIIGKQTAGKVLTMKVVTLPDGGLFLYPNTQTLTAKNEVLEGTGVVPDIIADLKIGDLLAGRDSQLEAAINYITGMKEGKKE